MLRYPAPMSNVERQRKFRASHPTYFNKYNGRIKAINKAVKAQGLAQKVAMWAAGKGSAPVELQAILAKREPLTLPAPPVRLALPAPVEVLVFPALPALQTIEARCVPVATAARHATLTGRSV
jgi:hypothetical protein